MSPTDNSDTCQPDMTRSRGKKKLTLGRGGVQGKGSGSSVKKRLMGKGYNSSYWVWECLMSF